MDRALIVVAKRPAPGQTKTRLTPPFSQDQAVTLYQCLLLDTLDLIDRVGGVRHVLAYTPDDAEPFFRGIAPPSFEFYPQVGTDLGSRLHNILARCLSDGCRQAVVMDGDSPTMPAEYLRQAFAALDDPRTDVVLGPCDDGGYYLIGLKAPHPEVFDVVMSTPAVLADTLAQAERAGLHVALLPAWYDVDTAHEVDRLREELTSNARAVAPRTRAWLANGFLSPAPEILDAGPTGCGELLMLVFQKMKTLAPGAVLEVLAYDPAAALDLAAWCRMTGHALRSQDVSTAPYRFHIQKRA